MSDSTEKEDYEDLVSSKGWGRLVTRYNHFFKGQFEDRVSSILEKGGGEDQLRQLVAIRKFVLEEVFKHPSLRVEQLTHAESLREPTMNRRGRL